MDDKLKQEVKNVIVNLFKEIDEIGYHTGCDFGVNFEIPSGKLIFNNPITGAQKAIDFCEKYNIDLSSVYLHEIGNDEILEEDNQ